MAINNEKLTDYLSDLTANWCSYMQRPCPAPHACEDDCVMQLDYYPEVVQMKSLTDEALAAYKEYLRDTMGKAPNRVLMNEDTARRFKDELLIECLYQPKHPLTEEQIIWNGMRLVIDPWADGIEVALAR